MADNQEEKDLDGMGESEIEQYLKDSSNQDPEKKDIPRVDEADRPPSKGEENNEDTGEDDITPVGSRQVDGSDPRPSVDESDPPPSGVPDRSKGVDEDAEKNEEKTPEQREKDAQAYKIRQELKARREEKRQREVGQEKRVRDLEIENLRLKAGSFKKMTDEELLELKQVDPDAWKEYLDKQKEVEGLNQQIKEKEVQHSQADQQSVALNFKLDLFDLVSELVGVEIPANATKIADLPNEVKNYLGSAEYRALAAEIDSLYPPDQGYAPTYDQMKKVADLLHAQGKGKAESIENLKNSIKNAANNTSSLNRHAPNKTATTKKWDNMTNEEVNALGETEMNAAMEYFEKRDRKAG